MNWTELTTKNELEHLKKESTNHKILIFKHSTRCSISAMALDRLERNWKNDEMKNIKPYYLDLLSYRDVSNQIAADFQVTHESPQVLIIENGKCIHHSSHSAISYDELKKILNK
ncbi:MAG: bacillithiol system redox-active protein YtxJ [Flammeovirgaceae bacterium]